MDGVVLGAVAGGEGEGAGGGGPGGELGGYDEGWYVMCCAVCFRIWDGKVIWGCEILLACLFVCLFVNLGF